MRILNFKENLSIFILFCGLAILIGIVFLAYSEKNELRMITIQENEAAKHLEILQTISANLVDMRSESITFLLYKDPMNLENFNALATDTEKLIEKIRSAEPDIGQGAAVDPTINDVQSLISQLRELVNIAQTQGFEVPRRNMPIIAKIEQLSTPLRKILELRNRNDLLIAQQNRAAIDAAGNAILEISIFVAVALVLIFSSLFMLMRYAAIRKRIFQEAHDLREILEEKNSELESVISTVSHDLRSPLVNIKGFSSELKRDISEITALVQPDKASQAQKLTSQVSDSIGFIESSAITMSSLIESLVRVARTGKQPVTPVKVDVSAMLAEIFKNYEFTIKENKIRIELADLPPCTADANHLKQVFSNLIGNAIKYRDPSRPLVLTVTGRRTSDHSTYCFIDNGIGISQQDQPKIFTMFFRASTTEKGDGLGLAIVKKLVELNKGHIRVQSQLGKGTSFCINLPA
ncbi:MAG: hypothetical protein A2Y07_06650 [Planctomycetes bacterium GWF2_50_10]|nr:MAG: hypothetical protein A2Y07_06650 [Planctomycetes bacterium GWF2_50_10]